MTDAFVHPLSVRYLEVDAQGVVFNMWYLGWIDDALTAFLAHNGLDYAQMMAAGYDVQLVHVSLDWREGLRWGDEAAVAVRLAKVGTTSFNLVFTFLRAGDPVAAAEVVYVCVAADGSGKRPLPALVLAGLGRSD